MGLSREELFDKIGCALKQLYSNDIYLIENNSHELSLEGRMAIYLQKYFSLPVDIDYNRKESSVKRISQKYSIDPGNKCGHASKPLKYEKKDHTDDPSFRPDIIIHKRGCMDNNLVAIELKKSGNADQLHEDYRKLCYLTDKDKGYHYSYGVGITFDMDHADIRLFVKGEMEGLYRFDKEAESVHENLGICCCV